MAGSNGGAVFEHYVQDIKSGVEDYCDLRCAAWKGNNADEVKAAFRDLVEWQFAYIRENGYPYNFITGKSYAEEMGLSTEEVKESPKESTNEAGLTDEEVEDILSELSDEEIEELKEAFAEESDKDSKKERCRCTGHRSGCCSSYNHCFAGSSSSGNRGGNSSYEQ